MGNYFTYNEANKRYSIAKDKKDLAKRPSNQNAKPVLRKIAKRLEKLIENEPYLQLTDLQQTFLIEVNKEIAGKKKKVELQTNKIDIAHHIAISTIMRAILKRMNHPEDFRGEDDEFVEAIISSDDPSSKETIKDFFKTLSDPDISSVHKIKEANKVVERINRASPNLIPGHSSTNRSVSDNKDLHLVKKGSLYTEVPRTKKIGYTADRFFETKYPPKTCKDNKKIKIQSSSIHADPNQAWIEEKKIFNYKMS